MSAAISEPTVCPSTARAILLARPLKFGDPLLIRCVDLLAQIEAAREIIRRCPHGYRPCQRCGGAGEIECGECGQDAECPECLGDNDACECVEGIPGDILAEAFDQERNSRPAQTSPLFPASDERRSRSGAAQVHQQQSGGDV